MSDKDEPRWVRWWTRFDFVASMILLVACIWGFFWGIPMLLQ